MARIYDFQNYVRRTAGAPSGMPSASPPPAPLDDAGDSAMRFAGDLWPRLREKLKEKGASASSFIASPRGLATGGVLALLGAAAAAGNAAQTQDPSLTGFRAAAGPAGAAAGSLVPTAVGGGLGLLLSGGNPLAAAAGATAANMLFGGAAAEGGADLARALTGVSPTDKAVNDYLRQARAQQRIAEEAAPLRNALADADVARQIRAAAAQSLLNSQNQMGQALANSLTYQSPMNPYIATID